MSCLSNQYLVQKESSSQHEVKTFSLHGIRLDGQDDRYTHKLETWNPIIFFILRLETQSFFLRSSLLGITVGIPSIYPSDHFNPLFIGSSLVVAVSSWLNNGDDIFFDTHFHITSSCKHFFVSKNSSTILTSLYKEIATNQHLTK